MPYFKLSNDQIVEILPTESDNLLLRIDSDYFELPRVKEQPIFHRDTGEQLGEYNYNTGCKSTLFRPNFKGWNANRFNFSESILHEADFSYANLNQSKFSKGDYKNSSFSGSDLDSASMHESDFKGCDFSNANLYNARAQRSDFRDVDFHSAYLKWTDFQGCNLDGANLNGADIRKCWGDGKVIRSTSDGFIDHIVYTDNDLAIEHLQYPIEEWISRKVKDIGSELNDKTSLTSYARKLWKKNKDRLIKQFENEGII